MSVTRYPRTLEWWISVVRLAATAFVVAQVSYSSYSSTADQQVAWELAGTLAISSVLLFALAAGPDRWWVSSVSMAFDFGIISAFALLYASEPGTPTRQLLLLPVVLGALRFGLPGGLVMAAAMVPVTIWFEWRRSDILYGHGSIAWNNVIFQAGAGLILALLIGALMRRIEIQRRNVERRAEEAEALRDELGRRADLLDAANRCARALSSSLDLDEAFGAFIRELRGLVPFERTAIVLVDGDSATTMATAGRGASDVFPPGSSGPIAGSVLERVLTDGSLLVRGHLTDRVYPADEKLLALGLGSELVTPLLVGARPIGMLSLSRERADAFSDDEIELVALLGRLVATAVQNIRAYEAERRRVEELGRLSQLRADFVSLVSHELRSPMAAVIGAARTLEDRWRMLTAAQRESFLALIGDETSRLAELVGDVLDTSRIEAGTFSYRFEEVDLGRVVDEAVEAAALAQQDVPVVASVRGALPAIRGDRARIRQVLGNLIENAVKYSPEGGEVRVSAAAANGAVRIAVQDAGPGIPRDQQARIFEKFGRVDVPGASKPGTGLGLFIARSIAEAHGGALEVTSGGDPGSTFTLTLPVGR